MKNIFLIISLAFSFSLFAQKDMKEWVKKNEAGVVIEKGYYKNKKQDGEWSFYFPDGKPSLKATYDNGVLNGKSIRYDLQGNIIAELTYQNGNLTGHQIYFYQTGGKLSEGEMLNGKEEGAWKYYNPKGEFMGYIKYNKGKQITEDSKN